MIEQTGFNSAGFGGAVVLGCSGCECHCTKPDCCSCWASASYQTQIGDTVDDMAFHRDQKM
jgi:hypothetical protein